MNAERLLLVAHMQIEKLKKERDELLAELKATESRLHEVSTFCATIWQQRDELLEVVREFVQTMDSLPDSNETSLRVWDVYDTASKLIEKMQRG